MNDVFVFNGIPYYAMLVAQQSKFGYDQHLRVCDLVVPEILLSGPCVVYQFEGKNHLLMGSIPPGQEFIDVKIINKHRMKFCRKDEADARARNVTEHSYEERSSYGGGRKPAFGDRDGYRNSGSGYRQSGPSRRY